MTSDNGSRATALRPERAQPGGRQNGAAKTAHRPKSAGTSFELPYPAKILWPNGRGHHMAKHREFQKHKQWAYHAALAEGLKNWPYDELNWSVTFYPKTRHQLDRDNAAASLKAYQDGIAQATGLDDKHFGTPAIHFGEPVKGGRIVVTIL